MRGGIFGALSLIFLGGIVADIWAHPTGTQAAGGALSSILKTSMQGVSGQKIT